MNRKLLFLSLMCISGIIAAQPALAQINCHIDYEVINNLEDPHMGSFNIWDNVSGAKNVAERFKSAIILQNGHTLAVGEKNAAGGQTALIMAEIDHRGRVVWQKDHEIVGLSNAVKSLPNANGFTVLAEIKADNAQQAWIGTFDLAGVLKTENTIGASKGDLHPEDIVSYDSSEDYLMSAHIETKQGGFYTQLYRLTPQGGVVFERAYRPGLDNKITSLGFLTDGQYIGAGLIRTGEGQEQGWIAAIDGQGNIIWQRPYPYGASSRLSSLVVYDEDRVVVVGDMLEQGGKIRNGWAMMIDGGSGETIWRRLYRSRASYWARDVIVSGDKISALFDTAQGRNEHQEFARLFTLDSRGVLLDEKGYFNGAGSRSSQLIAGKTGARIIVGNTDAITTRERTEAGKESWLKRP